MNRTLLVRSSIAAAVLAALTGSYWLGRHPNILQLDVPPQTNTTASVITQAAPRIMASSTDFSGIVERYGPAVVNISVTGKAQQVDLSDTPFGDDPFFDFFRHFSPQLPRTPRSAPRSHGQGSGFIVRADGLIITNAHVVNGAEEVTVKLTDRREFNAKVLGADKKTDVAVIKIDAKDLPVVSIGDPNSVRVGEPVLAIGSPYGFENTATSGIVSAKSRTLPDDSFVPFIQTDVAVNPGNSGGPLFNLRGEVIGINSQIYSQTGGYQGLSFAIPMDVVNGVQAQLVKHGKVTRGRIGVSIQDVNQALADSFGLKTPHGALVSSVEKGSPAETAGLKPGDVIIKLADRPIERSNDLAAQVANLAPGTPTTLLIVRQGKEQSLKVKIGEMHDDAVATNDKPSTAQGKLGLGVRALSRSEQIEAGIDGGLMVEQSSGPAAEAGVREGDIVIALNGTPVNSASQLRDLVNKAGKHAALLILRDTARIFVPIDLS